jgi:hypothetical protein
MPGAGGWSDRMSQLGFSVVGARVEHYAAVPTLMLRLRIGEASGAEIQAIALRCQIQIEPRKREYSGNEEDRLLELFGEPERWGTTLRPVLWSQASVMVPRFEGQTEIDLPLTCTYDFEVASAKYLQALDDGEIPLLLLFSGTVFGQGDAGFNVEQVPWDQEASFRLPVRLWREAMDHYFPGCAWVRLGRESFDALLRFKGRRALPTWDAAIDALLKQADEGAEV